MNDLNAAACNYKIVFPAGTVVLQYVNKSTSFVGVVADEKMIAKLNENDRSIIEWDKKNGNQYHVCLVLGWFQDYDESWSIFRQKAVKSFPWYTIGMRSTATATKLWDEIQLLTARRMEGNSRGLSCGNIRNQLFGFSPKKAETLMLVALTQTYMMGGDESDKPSWVDLNEFGVSAVFKALREAVPLSGSQVMISGAKSGAAHAGIID